MSTIRIRASVAMDAEGRYVVYGTSSDESENGNDDFDQAHGILQDMRRQYEIAPGMTSAHRTPPPGLIGGCTIEAWIPTPEMGKHVARIPIPGDEVQESPSVRSAAQEASQGPSHPEPASAGPKPDDAGLSPRHEHQVMAGHDGDSPPTLKGNLDSPTNLKSILEQTSRMKDPDEL